VDTGLLEEHAASIVRVRVAWGCMSVI